MIEAPIAAALLALVGAAGYAAWQTRAYRDLAAHTGDLREQYANLRTLHREALAACERDRQLMGQELHDDLAQSLTALRYNIEAMGHCHRICSPRPEQCSTRLDDIDQTMTHVSDQIRRISNRLRPSLLHEQGIEAALTGVVETFERASGTSVDLYVEGLEERPAADIETAVYRIAQESLTNAMRHADASQVEVRVLKQEGEIYVRIEDDGSGWDRSLASGGESDGPESTGLGLRGIEERARFLGGKARVSSIPNEGSVVEAWIPLDFAGESGGNV